MASSTSSFSAKLNSAKETARQWYAHAAGILPLWTRITMPWAVATIWFSGAEWGISKLLPLLVGPVSALLYAAGYIVLRAVTRLPLRWLKTTDAVLLLSVSCTTTVILTWVRMPDRWWVMGIPPTGLFVSAYVLNWFHKGRPEQPGQGSLPPAPPLTPPVTGQISAGYGSYDRSHTGVDIVVPVGTPVVAPAEGVVVHAGPLGQWGFAVLTDHGNGWASFLAHLDRPAVRAGTQVQPGDLLGWSGTSGISTGPHVHLELRYQGKPVNPEPMLNGASG